MEYAPQIFVFYVLYRFEQIRAATHFALDQMRDQFRVGVGFNLRALLFQLFTKLHVIFNNAVVYERDSADHMRMRIALTRFTVSGPAGVTDTEVARERFTVKLGT